MSISVGDASLSMDESTTGSTKKMSLDSVESSHSNRFLLSLRQESTEALIELICKQLKSNPTNVDKVLALLADNGEFDEASTAADDDSMMSSVDDISSLSPSLTRGATRERNTSPASSAAAKERKLSNDQFREMMDHADNSEEIQDFATFCDSVYAGENLSFYRDIQHIKREKNSRTKEKLARQLYLKYVAPGAAEPVNITHQAAAVLHSRFGVIGPTFFAKAEKAVYENLRSDLWFRYQISQKKSPGGSPAMSSRNSGSLKVRGGGRRVRKTNSLTLKKSRRLTRKSGGGGFNSLKRRSKKAPETPPDLSTESDANTPQVNSQRRMDEILSKARSSLASVPAHRPDSSSSNKFSSYLKKWHQDHSSSSEHSPAPVTVATRKRSQSWGYGYTQDHSRVGAASSPQAENTDQLLKMMRNSSGI